MKEETIWITNRFGEKLEATIRHPDLVGSFAVVLFVSGFGADLHETNNSFDETSERLVNQGYLTLQFSFAGRGKSEGVYETMTVVRQGQQVEDVIAWIRHQKNVDVSRIGVVAQSFGVPSILMADLRGIKSLCFLSGSYIPYQTLPSLFVPPGKYNPNGISTRINSNGVLSSIGPDFWKTLSAFRIQDASAKITSPVFVVHGDADKRVPLIEAKNAYTYILSSAKRIKIYPGGDHGITDVARPLREEFLEDVVSWFKETL